ncbi:MAG: hypothetical protein PHS45_00325, partial [Bacilli bacterium]|nr:hypothetical protein [Bacilli bacterium]
MDRRNKNDYRELCYLATLKVKKLNTSFDRSNSFRDMCRFIMTYSDDIPKFKKGRNYNPDFVVAVVLDFLYTLDSRYYTIAKEIILRDKIKIYNSDAIDLFLNNDNDDSILEDGPCVIFD